MSAPAVTERQRKRAPEVTDFQSLKHTVTDVQKPYQARTWTDFLIHFTTPFTILIMIASPIFFLLDVRFVYTEVSGWNLRWFAFWFVLGVVALNRLIAREGKRGEHSLRFGPDGCRHRVYDTHYHGVRRWNSFKRVSELRVVCVDFQYHSGGFIWWFTNRLTHECCVDDNPLAGDIGMLTSTAIKFRRAISQENKPQKGRCSRTAYSIWKPSIRSTGRNQRGKRNSNSTRCLSGCQNGIRAFPFFIFPFR